MMLQDAQQCVSYYGECLRQQINQQRRKWTKPEYTSHCSSLAGLVEGGLANSRCNIKGDFFYIAGDTVALKYLLHILDLESELFKYHLHRFPVKY